MQNRTDWGFMLDGTASTLEPDVTRFPRTAQEAFGHYDRAPLRKNLTFRPTHGHLWGVVAVVAVVGALTIAGYAASVRRPETPATDCR